MLRHREDLWQVVQTRKLPKTHVNAAYKEKHKCVWVIDDSTLEMAEPCTRVIGLRYTPMRNTKDLTQLCD